MFNILKTLLFPAETWPFRSLLLMLIAIDTAFIAIHLGLRLGVGLGVVERLPLAWNIISDDGLPEMFNHIKWALVILALIALFVMSRVALFAAMAVGFAIVLLDDRLGLHEAGGEALALRLPILHKLGIAPYQAGELVVWALFGTIIVAVAAFGYRLTPKEWRGVGVPFLLAFLASIFFAIGVDVLQEPFRWIPHEALSYWSIYALRIVEDGGEMYAASLTLAVAVTTFVAYRDRSLQAMRPARTAGLAEVRAIR